MIPIVGYRNNNRWYETKDWQVVMVMVIIAIIVIYGRSLGRGSLTDGYPKNNPSCGRSVSIADYEPTASSAQDIQTRLLVPNQDKCGAGKIAHSRDIQVYTDEEIASWYSVESCKREGTSGIMANGRKLNDKDYTCAIWNKKFGTILVVTNIDTGATVKVEVCDRGPNKRLVKEGRIIDLSMAAFKALSPLGAGLIRVKVEEINSGIPTGIKNSREI